MQSEECREDGGPARSLARVVDIKETPAGVRVTFRARALRFWDVGGVRMALVGDESALTRIELGDRACEAGASYEFRGLVVREYPGGWHSASVVNGSEVLPIGETVPVSQDEGYIERTFKILSGIQRKKARKEGRLPPWEHPGSPESGGMA